MTKSPLPKDVRELADWLQKNFNMPTRVVMSEAEMLLLFRQRRYSWLVRGSLGPPPDYDVKFGVATMPIPWYRDLLVYKVGFILCLNGAETDLGLRHILAHTHPEFYQWTPTNELWWEILRKPPKNEPALVAMTI